MTLRNLDYKERIIISHTPTVDRGSYGLVPIVGCAIDVRLAYNDYLPIKTLARIIRRTI